MPIGPARMPIMDHLGELRRRLTIIVVAVVVCALVVYFATPTLIELMIGQIEEAMSGAQLVVGAQVLHDFERGVLNGGTRQHCYGQAHLPAGYWGGAVRRHPNPAP